MAKRHTQVHEDISKPSRSKPRPKALAEPTIGHRRYRFRPSIGKPRPVDVYIHSPVPSGRDWVCKLRITGLPRQTDQEFPVYGVDSVQALELALRAVGQVFTSTPEYRAGQLECWESQTRDRIDLGLPLPFSSLQSNLENLRALLKRLAENGDNKEWRRGTLAVLEEISLDLATLAVQLPVEPRLRPGAVIVERQTAVAVRNPVASKHRPD